MSTEPDASPDREVAAQIAAEFAREQLIAPFRQPELLEALADRGMTALRWRALAERELHEEATRAERH